MAVLGFNSKLPSAYTPTTIDKTQNASNTEDASGAQNASNTQNASGATGATGTGSDYEIKKQELFSLMKTQHTKTIKSALNTSALPTAKLHAKSKAQDIATSHNKQTIVKGWGSASLGNNKGSVSINCDYNPKTGDCSYYDPSYTIPEMSDGECLIILNNWLNAGATIDELIAMYQKAV